MRKEFLEVLERAGRLKELNVVDLALLISADQEESAALFSLADKIRRRYVGDSVHIRGIVEFSNHCVKNCLYCGIRKDNTGLPRYRMSPQEIMACASKAAGLGCRTIVLQSGEDSFYTTGILSNIIFKIKKELDVVVTLSTGDKSREDYRILREAGADRYLLKHETCDARLFSALRPGTSLEGRVKRLKWLCELGYQAGSGNIVGLPGQTMETLAGDLILMRNLGVAMAGIGPFIPSKQTPLADEPGGTLEMSLKTLATARLVLPGIHFAATTAMNVIHPQGKAKALKCGANVIMPNMTPARYRDNYLIYPGKPGLSGTPEESINNAKKTVENVNLNISNGYGHSLVGYDCNQRDNGVGNSSAGKTHPRVRNLRGEYNVREKG